MSNPDHEVFWLSLVSRNRLGKLTLVAGDITKPESSKQQEKGEDEIAEEGMMEEEITEEEIMQQVNEAAEVADEGPAQVEEGQNPVPSSKVAAWIAKVCPIAYSGARSLTLDYTIRDLVRGRSRPATCLKPLHFQLQNTI
jgi:hypothetical protein